MLTAGLLVASVELPARSLTEALAARPVSSPVITLSAGMAAGSIPDRPSAAVQWMLTLPLYQPSAFGWVVGAPLRVGAVSSTLRPVRPALALLPAASTAVPLALWLAPSPTVLAAEQLSMPERLSAQVKLTITSSLYQPLALAARSGAALIVGAVLSMLTSAGSVAVLLAL